MKIVFMGTPDFAVPSLEALINSNNEVLAVFTQPDKKVGRKQIITPPPVKDTAEAEGIPVYQPQSLKNSDAADIIESLNPDVIIVVAYGKILPKEILKIPRFGCINVHASLLPKYRGAAPIQWAVLNGDSETGVCIMQMDEGLDTGDILLCEKTEIGINETSEELFERLSAIGAASLVNALDMLENGELTPVKQLGESTYASMIDKSLCPIDWNKSAFEIHNKIRGLQSWPCATAFINGNEYKIHKSVLSDATGAEAGEVIYSKNALTVSCGDGKCIDILEIQAQGKKRMDIKAFLAGNRIEQGTILK